jgi:glycosyltransferase involved in cell wall biosynthesis
LVPFLLRKRADVYHVHDPELVWVALLLRALGRRVVYDAHEDLPEQIRDKEWILQPLRAPLSRLLRVLLRVASRGLSGVVAATEDVAKGFRGRVTVVRNYPVVSLFPAPAGSDPAWTTLIYVGGVSFSRGLREMVEAAERLPKVRLHLVGSIEGSGERAYLEKRDPTRVVVEPWMQPLDVYRRLAQADIGIALLHSIPRYRDALPVKLFEYMAAGLPVIASDFPAWREIVSVSNCGLLVDPAKIDAFCEAVAFLAGNPTERQRMGENGRRAVKTTYSWQRESGELLRLYEEILGDGT